MLGCSGRLVIGDAMGALVMAPLLLVWISA